MFLLMLLKYNIKKKNKIKYGIKLQILIIEF
jgi:hypothetical protein